MKIIEKHETNLIIGGIIAVLILLSQGVFAQKGFVAPEFSITKIRDYVTVAEPSITAGINFKNGGSVELNLELLDFLKDETDVLNRWSKMSINTRSQLIGNDILIINKRYLQQ